MTECTNCSESETVKELLAEKSRLENQIASMKADIKFRAEIEVRGG